VIGRILGTRWRHVLPCYTCLSETLDVFYIKKNWATYIYRESTKSRKYRKQT